LNSNSLLAWENLLLSAYKSFNINEYNVKNLTSKIKNNIASFSLPTSISKNKFSNSLARRIEAKVNEFLSTMKPFRHYEVNMDLQLVSHHFQTLLKLTILPNRKRVGYFKEY
jgi:hypothetical protein